ncbi:MAG: hypothetical protein KA796_08625 [Chryseobacterium sp.]|nr:hypothetical protein [Chryseobacterium sp.]
MRADLEMVQKLDAKGILLLPDVEQQKGILLFPDVKEQKGIFLFPNPKGRKNTFRISSMMTLLIVISILIFSCKDKPEPVEVTKSEKIDSVKIETKDDSANIKKAGSSFYDWYFNNDFNDYEIVKNKNGKALLDSATYFKKLRNLGTISERFINKEKERLSTCSKFLATKYFDDYNSADAYTFDDYCPDLYFMYWIKSQERPEKFVAKDIKQIDENNASLDINLNYGGKDEPLSKVILAKENNSWKIVDIKFSNQQETPITPKTLNGNWSNAMVTLHISDDGLAFEYHGQCMYFYPIRKISATEFEMIWAREMDCKFDNGTKETFGMKNVPVIGKPFAKFTLKNNVLQATYFYPEWVKKYTEKVQDNVFTADYFKNEENL